MSLIAGRGCRWPLLRRDKGSHDVARLSLADVRVQDVTPHVAQKPVRGRCDRRSKSDEHAMHARLSRESAETNRRPGRGLQHGLRLDEDRRRGLPPASSGITATTRHRPW